MRFSHAKVNSTICCSFLTVKLLVVGVLLSPWNAHAQEEWIVGSSAQELPDLLEELELQNLKIVSVSKDKSYVVVKEKLETTFNSQSEAARLTNSLHETSFDKANAMARRLKRHRFVEPNLVYRHFAGGAAPSRENLQPQDTVGRVESPLSETIPNDPMFPNLWALRNIGQAPVPNQNGRALADVQATQAWTSRPNLSPITVAVIDSGIDANHEDLRAALWQDPTSSFLIYGFDTILDQINPVDENGHGTHVAGTIAATWNNALGTVGLAPNARIMAVRFLGKDGSGSLANAIQAIDWAREHGAQILSNSWGGGGYSKALQEAIERAQEAGILFVAAAGNDARNNDRIPAYPASYKVSNVVSVAATTNRDVLAKFSNFGATSVHLAAPGEHIGSTLPGNRYGFLSGTSMATPHVSAAAAMYLGVERASPEELKKLIMESSEKIEALRGKVAAGSGRLNVFNLLNGVIVKDPSDPTDEDFLPPTTVSIESAHPYTIGKNERFTIRAPRKARAFQIRFQRIQLAEPDDTLTLELPNSQRVAEYRGLHHSSQWSPTIVGNEARLVLRSPKKRSSRGPEFGWGFRVVELRHVE